MKAQWEDDFLLWLFVIHLVIQSSTLFSFLEQLEERIRGIEDRYIHADVEVG